MRHQSQLKPQFINMENNSTEIFLNTEFQEMTSVLEGYWTWLYVGTIGIFFTFGFLVHRSLHYTFGRLGSRHINQMIMPSLWAIEIISPPYCLFMMGKAMYYPLGDIFGVNFCNFMAFGESAGTMYCQLLTFFIALFRYTCICHHGFLIRWSSPKVSKFR